MSIFFTRTFDHELDMPTRGSEFAAGLDLPAAEHAIIEPGKWLKVRTGWSWNATAHPEIYGRCAPRSGLSNNNGLFVNAGVVDADYTGEINVILYNPSLILPFEVKYGMRIAQLILEKHEGFRIPVSEHVDNNADTARGSHGFGSTGE